MASHLNHLSIILALLLGQSAFAVSDKTQGLLDQHQTASGNQKARIEKQLLKVSKKQTKIFNNDVIRTNLCDGPNQNLIQRWIDSADEILLIHKSLYGSSSTEYQTTGLDIARTWARFTQSGFANKLLKELLKELDPQDYEQLGDIYVELARTYSADVYSRGEAFFQLAMDSYRKAGLTKSDTKLGNVHLKLGKHYINHNQFDEGEAQLLHAKDVYSDSREFRYEREQIMQYESFSAYLRGDLKDVDKVARDLKRKVKDPRIEQDITWFLFENKYVQAKYNEIEETLQYDSSLLSNHHLYYSARLYLARGQYKEAEGLLAVLLFGKRGFITLGRNTYRCIPGAIYTLGPISLIADYFTTYSEALAHNGKYTNALKALQAANRIRNRQVNTNQIAVLYTDLRIGALHERFGYHDLARDQYERTANDFKNLEQAYKSVNEFYDFYLDLGRLYVATGNYKLALDNFNLALTKATSLFNENHRNLHPIFQHLAEYYWVIGDYDQALENVESGMQVIANRYDSNHPRHAHSLQKRAKILIAKADFAGARQDLGKAKIIYDATYKYHHESYIDLYNQLAIVENHFGKTDDVDKALLEVRSRLDVQYPNGSPTTLNYLISSAELYLESERYEAATDSLAEALTLISGIDYPEMEWRAYWDYGKVLAAIGSKSNAIIFGKKAINGIQSLRTNTQPLSGALQKIFIQNRIAPYRDLADWLIDLGRLSEAHQVIGLLKQEEYFDFIRRDASAEKHFVSLSKSEAKVLNHQERLTNGIVESDIRLKRLQIKRSKAGGLDDLEEATYRGLLIEHKESKKAFRQYLLTLQREMRQKGGRELESFAGMNLQTLPALQGMLKGGGNDTAIVHYLMTEKRLRILLTTPLTQLSRDSNITRQELNQMIFAYREEILDLSDSYQDEASDLYDAIIKPIESDLMEAGIHNIVVSLDSSLRYLPLSALYDGEKFLIEKYNISLFNPAAHMYIGRPPVPISRIAGFGVSESIDGFPALPEVENELSGIIRTGDNDGLGVAPGVIYMNSDFSADQFSQILNLPDDESYPVIHIAAHFTFSSGSEIDSYLLLGDKSRLSLEDFRYGNFPLHNVDLLTLSACETGISGLDSDGSEIEGFATMAQNLGARSVIATLWQVADSSTADLMQRFYAYRIQGDNKTEGLGRVQREFIREERYSHPFFWAPFILMGSWI